MNFCSDNTTGASPEILQALVDANDGDAMPYGADPWTERAVARIREVFETDAEVFLVTSGTAANSIALSAMAPPFGAIFCHPEAHANCDECGGPEMFTGGAKLISLPDRDGKVAADDLAAALGGRPASVHQAQPAAVTLTQAAETGVIYGLDELSAICAVAHDHGLKVHMDGARFANALVSLGATPAEATWKRGIDVLSLGASKNGALALEAIVVFERGLAHSLPFRRKRAGHLLSKGRVLGAQMVAYLAGDLWLTNARHANAMAARLAEGLGPLPGVDIDHAVQANEIFARIPGPAIDALLEAGFKFYQWERDGSPVVRLVTAFNTRPGDVDAFVATAAAALS